MENEILEVADVQPLFTSQVTHDLTTRKEVNSLYSLLHLATIVREATIVIILAVLFGYLFLYSGSRDGYSRTIFVVTLFYWGSFLFKQFRRRGGGESYRLMLQRNGGNPVHNIITFGETSFMVKNTYTEEVNEYTYDRIRSIAQSKNYLLLYRNISQCTVVSKTDLTGGTAESLLRFLFDKMPVPKTRTPKVGLIIRWVGYALWVLSLGLALYCQFFLL